MIELRNALAAGVMVAAALIVPVTTSAQSVAAGTVPEGTVVSTHTFAQKPCWKYNDPAKRAACYRWRY